MLKILPLFGGSVAHLCISFPPHIKLLCCEYIFFFFCFFIFTLSKIAVYIWISCGKHQKQNPLLSKRNKKNWTKFAWILFICNMQQNWERGSEKMLKLRETFWLSCCYCCFEFQYFFEYLTRLGKGGFENNLLLFWLNFIYIYFVNIQKENNKGVGKRVLWKKCFPINLKKFKIFAFIAIFSFTKFIVKIIS